MTSHPVEADMIDASIERKMVEVERTDMTPHPVEFDMYYSREPKHRRAIPGPGRQARPRLPSSARRALFTVQPKDRSWAAPDPNRRPSTHRGRPCLDRQQGARGVERCMTRMVQHRPIRVRPRPERATRASRAQSRGRLGDGKLGQNRGFTARSFWVYIMASGPRGVLYIGMTSDPTHPRARRRPVHRVMASRLQRRDPAWRQVHIDQEPRDLAIIRSRASVSSAA